MLWGQSEQYTNTTSLLFPLCLFLLENLFLSSDETRSCGNYLCKPTHKDMGQPFDREVKVPLVIASDYKCFLGGTRKIGHIHLDLTHFTLRTEILSITFGLSMYCPLNLWVGLLWEFFRKGCEALRTQSVQTVKPTDTNGVICIYCNI